MLNLLPKDAKNKVRGEYLRRFSIVSLIGLSIINIFLLVSIFPSYVSFSTKKKIATDVSNELKKSTNEQDRDKVISNLRDLEDRLKIVGIVPGEKPTSYIDKAIELQTKGVIIQNISYTKKEGGKKEVSLEGVASSRASLIEFSKKVKSSNWAAYSDIPISNLASDKNIKFFVNLTSASTTK